MKQTQTRRPAPLHSQLQTRSALPKEPLFRIGDEVFCEGEGALGKVEWVFNSLFSQFIVYNVRFPNQTNAAVLYEPELQLVRGRC